MEQPTLFPEIPTLPTTEAPSTRLTKEDKLNGYDGFVEKFKPKKTTDDCYTPPYIYDVIRQWVNDNICPLDGIPIIRPFYPGGDYENAEYPAGCIVLDNPPFSILAKIRRFYAERGIRYFLFAPALTLFAAPLADETYICANCDITYENGAIVHTSFVTNLTPETRVHVAGDLFKAVRQAIEIHKKETHRELQKHFYPVNVITSALLGKIAARGISFKVPATDASFTRRLDSQIPHHQNLFGGGFLLSERAAAERAAAERAAAERAAAERAAAERAAAERAAAHTWELSPRERAIIASLG